MMMGSATSVVATHAVEGEFRAMDATLVIFTMFPTSVKRAFARILNMNKNALSRINLSSLTVSCMRDLVVMLR